MVVLFVLAGAVLGAAISWSWVTAISRQRWAGVVSSIVGAVLGGLAGWYIFTIWPGG